MTRFSVIIPCHNAAATIGATLEALVRQTDSDWEAICIDDGSTDSTNEIIASHTAACPRIRLHASPGRGPSDARNHGAALARGEILAFCDADDLWAPTKLMELEEAFADLWVDGVFGRVAFFDDDPAQARVTSRVPAEPLSIEMLLGENPVCTMSNITLRRSAFERSGGLCRDMVHNEDLDWLIRLVGDGARIVGLDRVQVFYRANPTGLSANLTSMAKGRRAALESAAQFGFAPNRRHEAVHFRYLARRALRLDAGRATALELTLRGLAKSPRGFLSPLRRGLGTAIGAAAAPFLPRRLRRALFSR